MRIIIPALSDVRRSLENEFARRIESDGAVGTGRGLSSIQSREMSSTQGVDIDLLAERYLSYLNDGTKGSPDANPSPVLVRRIKVWSGIKGIPREAAFPIARSIRRGGIDGRGWLEDILRDNIGEYADQVVLSWTRIQEEDIRKDLNEIK